MRLVRPETTVQLVLLVQLVLQVMTVRMEQLVLLARPVLQETTVLTEQ